jgi:uncharacterized protein (TIGR02246 family)
MMEGLSSAMHPPSEVFMPASSRPAALVAALAACLCLSSFAAGESAGRDEQGLRAAAERYREALDRGDGKALAALWTADGDIVDEQGNVLAGRTTVAATVPPTADATRPAFRINDTKLRFLTDAVAIEDGTVEVSVAGLSRPLKGRFSATWVKETDGWKITALREDRLDAPPGAETLEDLDWMVGDWVILDERAGKPAAGGPEKPAIEMSVRWNANRTFLLRDVKIAAPGDAGDAAALHVTQRIGWDPLSRQLRSWVFSSDGGHGEATWSRDGDSWVARTTGVLPDGSQTSSLNIYTFDGKDRCAWRSLPTHIGGEHTPPLNLTMIRKGGKP